MGGELLELAERCEAATGPDRELDAAIWCALNGLEYPEPPYFQELPHNRFHPELGAFEQGTRAGIMLQSYKDNAAIYTASLDAAMTLVPEGWRWIMREARPDKANPGEQGFFARLETADFESVTWGKGSDWLTDIVAGQDVFCWAATPALALCAAALKARSQTSE